MFVNFVFKSKVFAYFSATKQSRVPLADILEKLHEFNNLMQQMKNTLILFFITFNLQIFAQNDSIRILQLNELSYKIDKNEFSKFKKINYELDTISISITKFENKIETENFFKKSGTKLLINYYYQASKLVLVSVKEYSPKSPKLFLTHKYYYENEKLLKAKKLIWEERYNTDSEGGHYQRGLDIYQVYGYNKYLNDEFIKVYIDELNLKIKNIR